MLAAGVRDPRAGAPQAVTSLVRTAGVDLVILQDGSSSMHVTDVRGNRWQRSMRFLRTLGESLRWENDRVAMALFAHMATPQIRLTKDPNTYFFFLDHLEEKSPFRLEDDGTWDTNIERGIYWGLRLIEKDEEMRRNTADRGAEGRLPEDDNAQRVHPDLRRPVVERRGRQVAGPRAGEGGAAERHRRRHHGGRHHSRSEARAEPAGDPLVPQSRRAVAAWPPPAAAATSSSIAKPIATSPTHIIEQTRRRAGTRGVQEGTRDLYWNFLFAAGGFLGLGVLFLRDRVALALQLSAAAAVLIFVQSVF